MTDTPKIIVLDGWEEGKKPPAINFVCYEQIGSPIHLREEGVDDKLGACILERKALEEGMLVWVPHLMGWGKGVVTFENGTPHAKFGEGRWVAFLEWEDPEKPHGRGWISAHSGSLDAVARLSIS